MAGCLNQGCPLKRDAHCWSLQADNLIEPSNLQILWMDDVPAHLGLAVHVLNIHVHQGRHMTWVRVLASQLSSWRLRVASQSRLLSPCSVQYFPTILLIGLHICNMKVDQKARGRVSQGRLRVEVGDDQGLRMPSCPLGLKNMMTEPSGIQTTEFSFSNNAWTSSASWREQPRIQPLRS